MLLTQSQVEYFWRDGYILLPNLFEKKEIERLVEEIEPLKISEGPHIIRERDKNLVRALMGCHFQSELFRELIRQPRLLEPAEQLLGSKAYVYQFKINLKTSFGGDIWPWHQDFIYWHNLDGMPYARVVNFSIFLDECTEFNGPLWLIPGSHKEGILNSDINEERSSDWSKNVSTDLTFKLDHTTVARLIGNGNIVSPKGDAGTMLIFHPNLAHASLPNISPFERKLLIITYNSVFNIPKPTAAARPHFLVNPNTSAEMVSENSLLNS